jgi:hypothetical protein
MVDIDDYGLMQLVDSIVEHYMWGSKQYISLWCELDSGSMEIKSDENLHEWFQLNVDRVVHINAQINDFEGPLQFSPTKHRFHPSVRNKTTPIEPPTIEPPTTEPLTNERITSTTNKKTGRKTKRTEPIDGEGVAVDEEGMYSNTDSLVAPSDSSYDSDLADPEFESIGGSNNLHGSPGMSPPMAPQQLFPPP